MLPESLSGSYRRYKEDTNVFATWLSHAAKACGYHHVVVDNSSSSSTASVTNCQKPSKGNVASGNPAPSKHLLPTKDIENLARLVAESKEPIITVPQGIQGVLYRAIRARKRCTAVFQQLEVKNNTSQFQESNASHLHFIKVLESAYELLHPIFDISPTPIKSQPTKLTTKGISKTSDSIDFLGNQFELLQVEEIEDQDLEFSAFDPIVKEIFAKKRSSKMTKKSKSKPGAVFEIDLALDAELPFMVYCFYEDLGRYRKFLGKIWQEYADGSLDLLTSSLVTNITIELACKFEEELIARSPKRFGKKPSYCAITSIIHPVPSINKNTLDLSFELVRDSTLGELIYSSTFISLRKCANFIMQKPGSIPSVIPVRSLYIKDRAMVQHEEEIEVEDVFLSQILLDLQIQRFQDQTSPNSPSQDHSQGNQHSLPYEDVLTKGFRSMLHKGKSADIGVWVVFGARILLDIQKILGKTTTKPYAELRQRAALVHAALGFNTPDQEKLLGPFSPVDRAEDTLMRHWGLDKKAEKCAEALSSSIASVLWKNSLTGSKQKFLKNQGRPIRISKTFSSSIASVPLKNPLVNSFFENKCSLADQGQSSVRNSENQGAPMDQDISPSSDDSFFCNHNPIYCGLEAIKLAIGAEKVGVKLANTCCSLVAVVHLYNASRQLNLLSEEWQDLKHAITFNLPQLFKGSLPNDERTIFNRFHVVTGFPLDAFARNHRGAHVNKPDSQAIFKNARTLLKCTEYSDFLDKYIQGADSADTLLANIDQEANKTEAHSKRDRSRFMLLKQLRVTLPEVLPRVDTEYVRLTRQCNTLLLRIRRKLISEGVGAIEFPGMRERQDFAEAFEINNITTICEIFMWSLMPKMVADRNSGKGFKPAPSGTLRNPGEDRSFLESAAECIEAFLPQANISPNIQPFDVESYQATAELFRQNSQYFESLGANLM
jgi:hypothetical protein